MKKSIIKQLNRPFLMTIKPLWLREKLFWRFYYKNNSEKFLDLFDDSTLEFAPDNSLKLVPSDIGHRQIAFLGFCELVLSRHISKLAKLGGLMVDVGANYGYYSCIWAAANANNHVIAFEASPRNIPKLKLNLSENRLESQVSISEMAVGKKAGKLPFVIGPAEQTGWGGLSAHYQKDTIEVTATTLDNFFLESNQSDFTQINVLKIDTEGADTWVIQGAEQLLRSHRINHVYFEENISRMQELGIQAGEAQKLLKSCGYRVRYLSPNEYYARLS